MEIYLKCYSFEFSVYLVLVKMFMLNDEEYSVLGFIYQEKTIVNVLGYVSYFVKFKYKTS